jgi:hypothetical protein
MASPGFWCYVVVTGKRRKSKAVADGGTPVLEPGYHPAFIQTAIDTSPDHEPEPPEKGLPGTWIVVTLMSQAAPVATYAWVPTKEEPAVPPDGGSQPEVNPLEGHKSKSKH